MRYIVFMMNAGITGTDSADFAEFEDYITNDELSEEAWQRGLDHASSYGVYPSSEMPEDYDENEADWRSDEYSDEYSDDIEGYWEEYDPKKHDGLIVGRGPAFKNYKP